MPRKKRRGSYGNATAAALRFGIRRHGSLERLHRIEHASSVAGPRKRRRIIRIIGIPAFHGWYLCETPKAYYIVSPTGRIPTMGVFGDVEYPDEDLIRFQNPHRDKERPEALARHAIAVIKQLVRLDRKTAMWSGVFLHSVPAHLFGGAKGRRQAIVIKKTPPAGGSNPLFELAHRFLSRFRHHMGG